MRVLHLESGRHMYGGARQVLYLVAGLEQKGVESILAVPERSELGRMAAPFATKVRYMPMRGDLDLALAFRLRALIRETGPDLLHVHSRRGADFWGGVAARQAGIPAVLSRRVDNPEHPWLVAMKYRLYRRIVTISEGIREVLLSEGVPADQVTCVRSAVRAAEYQHPCERSAFRRELGLPDSAIIAGMLAQLIQRKGHRHLVEALPRVIERHPELHVVLFGQGPLRNALEQAATAAHLQGHVHFLGFRDDLPRLLTCLDLIVHPADIEGLGVSLLQGAAAGIPLIGTRTGGIPEIVRDEETGILIRPGDVPALSAAICRLLENPDLRRRLGEGGRKLVETEFDVQTMVDGNLAVYHSVLDEQK
jgi:glycosyltransferase involved in cell wall biosynthesis